MLCRFDEIHYLFRSLLGTNHFANLSEVKPSVALDIGCGSGIWVLEMANDYPWCQFVGLDIVQVQPRTIIPTNVQFVTADVLKRTDSVQF
jgi:tRNA G46 methylase TrmB